MTGRTLLVAALLENPYELYDLAPHRPIWTLRSRRRARAGRAVLEYYDGYAPTWRASPDWAAKFGYSESDLARTNEAAVAHLDGLRKRYGITDCVISSAIGPRGDGYVAGTAQTPDEAADYHAVQIAAMGGADMVTAYTLNYTAEAIGILRAARAHGRPVAISFTVETDGRLPGGTPLAQAIQETDDAAAPDYFLVNCAHPVHIGHSLTPGPWLERIQLDETEELDEGDPQRLAADHRALEALLPNLSIMGCCCCTDARHVAARAVIRLTSLPIGQDLTDRSGIVVPWRAPAHARRSCRRRRPCSPRSATRAPRCRTSRGRWAAPKPRCSTTSPPRK